MKQENITDIYKICLVPEDGATLKARTNEEWSLGYMFRIIWSESPLFKTGQRINIDDLTSQEEYHPVRFLPEFETLSVAEKLRVEAPDDYFAQTIVDTMVVGDTLILKRGQ